MTIEEKFLFTFPFFAILVLCIVISCRLSVKTKSVLFIFWILLASVWFWHRPQYLLHRWKTDSFEDSNVSILSFGLRAHAYAYEEFLSDIVFYRPILQEVLLNNPDPKMRIRAALFLGYSKKESDRQTFYQALEDPEFSVRLAASLGLLPQEYSRSPESFLAYSKFCLLMKQVEDCNPDEKLIREFVDLSKDQIR
ncbi:HEAT repeat domain-containing protein [Leptospira sp. FAT2]|uniref:HEAT repeat domain-containing protein n=1 Tax=Leptospira sanjuanensis TaxID=2879643 RepID=UPI001EE8F77E|nr:HEAT repeat domain-containing protein [Leptospira sanjuanensis]MCG6168376.1 HEAT repeat domain-containing protein [Leptospira sanjuanensis]MCG6193794.1 HEAT repeat domain-containing protein [Leptospira sanjuanensis]